jgi:hypothetical protein
LKSGTAHQKGDGRSYRLHGEEKEVARCIAESVRWRPEALLVSKSIPVTLVEDALNPSGNVTGPICEQRLME